MKKRNREAKHVAIGMTLSVAFLFVFAMPTILWAGTAQEGQKIFQDKCVRCHAEDGSGSTIIGKALGAADLGSAAVQKKTDADFYTQIEKGKGNMPPFGSGLDKTQINELIAYVRQFGRRQSPKKKR